jgi:hypothetical protein
MYRKRTWIAFIVLAAAVARAQEPGPGPPPKQPAALQSSEGKLPVIPEKVVRRSGKMFIQVTEWDFGHVPQDAQISHRFMVENVGKDTLYLERIKPT